jgi:spermidine/putrescine-binding protein
MSISRVLIMAVLAGLLVLSGCKPAPVTPSPESPTPIPTPTEPTDQAPQGATPTSTPSPSPTSVPSVTPTPTPLTAAGAVRVLAPNGSIPDWLKDKWSARLGQGDVSVDFYADETAANAKFSQNNYDAAIIPDRIAANLIKDQKLHPLGASEIGLKADPQFLHHFFDPTNHYVYPCGFTLLGVAYPSAHFRTTTFHWAYLIGENLPFKLDWAAAWWKNALENALKNKRLRSLTAAPLLAAKKDEKNQAKTETPETGQPQIKIGTVADLKREFGSNQDWKIAVPEEGSLITLYLVCIPAKAANVSGAKALLQELFAPETASKWCQENGFGVTQKAARLILTKESLSTPDIYPSKSVMDKSVFVKQGSPIP